MFGLLQLSFLLNRQYLQMPEIATGKRADLLVTDENLYPLSVYRYGTLVASVPKNYSD